ncbi:MAG: asparagine synthase (glutamine-hydrolyzing) [Pyrinomonadaceae bacterium]|nr:asparagine synthase (glutamine-hydrolyzing) [Phycisphaerales bacterium]
MCGIAGIIRITAPSIESQDRRSLSRPSAEAIPEAWLDALDNSIKHRGPDGTGRFRDRAVRSDGAIVDVALVHRRLSIIDHACGHQPMVSLGKGQGVITDSKHFDLGSGLGLYEPGGFGVDLGPAAQAARGIEHADPPGVSANPSPTPEGLPSVGSSRVAVVFNGCIYNHRELRRQLEAMGHVFSTDHSDTEVLVHGWREWGERLFEKLEGMFALMVWDGASGACGLARDQFGEKPLYTAHIYKDGAWFNLFASVPVESTALRSLLETSEERLEPHESVTTWIRFGWSTYPFAVNSDAVTYSEAVIYDATGGTASRAELGYDLHGAKLPRAMGYGLLTPDREAADVPRTRPISVEQMDRLLRQAVHRRLESDVSLGCFLSGGIDSALIGRYAKETMSSLRTFTVRMPDAAYDESENAAASARVIGSRHATLECAARPAEDLLMLVPRVGLPFGDSSLLPAYWVSRAARQEVSVALSGDGGDELFGGYERYSWVRTLSRLPPQFGWLGAILERGATPKSRRSKVGRLLSAAAGHGYFDVLSIFPFALVRKLMPWGDRELREQTHYYRTAYSLSSSERAMWFDLHSYLPGDLLLKTDAASMVCALEVRCPFLDRDLADAALRAPIKCLMPGKRRKGLLRAVARKYFPADIVDRPKMGFAIPIGDWFRTNFGGMRDLLHDHLSAQEPFGPPSLEINLDMDFVRQMLREHDMAGEKSVWPWKGRDHSQRLYMLLVLSIWARWIGNQKWHTGGGDSEATQRGGQASR